MKIKDLKGTWLILNSYKDHESGFLLTETSRYYGDLSDAIESACLHRQTQDFRVQYYSDKDETSVQPL